jgi:hypothetical protein
MPNELMSNELKQWFFRDSLNTILSLRYDDYREMFVVSISNVNGENELFADRLYSKAFSEYSDQLTARNTLMSEIGSPYYI